MTNEQLRACGKKELAEQARDQGISGWHAMRKEELLEALLRKIKRQSKSKPSRPAPQVATKTVKSAPASESPTKSTKVKEDPIRTTPAVKAKPQKAAARDTTTTEPTSPEETIERSKYDVGVPTRDLSSKMSKSLPNGYGKDRIVVMVRDPFWLHAYWELTHQAVQRAEAGLGMDWHGSRPILRIVDVSSQDTTSTSESHIRDIEIHGGSNNWYIEVDQPPRSYRVDVGYVSKRGQFFVLARSNTVTTPRAGVSDAVDETWAESDSKQADRIFAMSSGFDPTAGSSLELKQFFEEKFRRPMSSPAISSFGSGAFLPGKQRKFWFQLDAELIVYGATEPDAHVTLQNEPIKLRPDGTFTMRFSLPDARQIIPAVATSADGIEERTIVLAVERNTKQLEPLIHEVNGES